MSHVSVARTFLAISSDVRSRIFLLTPAQGMQAPQLEQITTINGPAQQAAALVDALNDAAWNGDRSGLDSLLAALPDPVVQSCARALDRCPAPDAVPIGLDDRPMGVIRRVWFSSVEEVAEHMRAAITLGLQLVVTNEGDDGLDLTATLLSGEVEIPYSETPQWLPTPEGDELLERLYPREENLDLVFGDLRWEAFASRAYWLWVQDEHRPDSANAEIVVEHFDRLINPRLSYLDFHAEDDSDDTWRGPLTPRNRFDLYLALFDLCVDLDALLGTDLSDEVDCAVRDDLPPLVRCQPRSWWEQLHHAAERLFEAARTGLLRELEPRTVAEEALLALATSTERIDAATTTAGLLGLAAVRDRLPRDPDRDGDVSEILPRLCGDADVVTLWNPHLRGIEDPANPMNQLLGMGDYRPEVWHRLFDRARAEPR